MASEVDEVDGLLDVVVKGAWGKGQGTDCATCSCGRINFNDQCQRDGEQPTLEELRRLARLRPKEYHEQGGPIHSMILNDRVEVIDCPCGQVLKLLRGLWEERPGAAILLYHYAQRVYVAQSVMVT